MIKKLICAAALLMVAGLQHTRAQYVYGTTGLLHAPSADMQRDKTFLCGFSYLQVAATPKHWNYDTWNYYINITLFPWLEVGYTCTLHKIGLPQYGYSYKFRNQDRQFSARLRVWKEGWWKEWTPQIVVGANDPSTNDVLGDPNKDDYGFTGTSSVGNGHWNRYYIVATKHFGVKNVGSWGCTSVMSITSGWIITGTDLWRGEFSVCPAGYLFLDEGCEWAECDSGIR